MFITAYGGSMINFINSWKANAKQKDRVNITIRFRSITILEIKYDVSDKKLRLMIINLGLELGGNKQKPASK